MVEFSIIIPVYNCEKYLEISINAIIKLQKENYEIILVDDGSTDLSAEICDKLTKKYEKIRCIHQNNQGVSEARNRGLQLAIGEYVLFLDADDTIETEKLCQLMKIIEVDTSIDMAVFGMSFDYYYQGKLYRQDKLPPPFNGKVCKEQWLERMYELYTANSLSPIWNKIIRRSILKKNNLILSSEMFIYEDLEYSLRCMAYCDNIYFDSNIIYHYRQAEDEGNAGRRLTKIDHITDLIKKIEKALDELIKNQNAQGNQKGIKTILLKLYLTLAREKISVTNTKGIKSVCIDFRTWFVEYDGEYLNNEKTYITQLLNRKIYILALKRYYTAIRHKLAIRIKSMNWYQRRKCSG